MLYKWHQLAQYICLMSPCSTKVFFQVSHEDRLHFGQEGNKWHHSVSAPVSVGVSPQGCCCMVLSSPQLASPFFPCCWFILLSYFFSLASSRHGQSAVKHWFSLWRLSVSPVLLQTAHAHFACFANEQKVFQLLNRLLKMYFWSLFLFFLNYFLGSKLFLNLVQTLFLLSKYWYNIW